MASLIAGQLEARNIGSNISFDWEGSRVLGKVAQLEKCGSTVELTLATSGDTFELTAVDPVDIYLSAEAQFAFNTKNAIDQLVEQLRPRNTLVAA